MVPTGDDDDDDDDDKARPRLLLPHRGVPAVACLAAGKVVAPSESFSLSAVVKLQVPSPGERCDVLGGPVARSPVEIAENLREDQ